MNVLGPDFRAFIDCMNDHGVLYILVGGYSVIMHGYNRTTGDLDVWVKPTSENYDCLVDAFGCFSMPVFDMDRSAFLNNTSMDVFTFGRPPVAIDIMTRVKGLDFDEAYKNAIVRSVDGSKIRVLGLPDLIKSKRASDRPKDQDDIQHLS